MLFSRTRRTLCMALSTVVAAAALVATSAGPASAVAGDITTHAGGPGVPGPALNVGMEPAAVAVEAGRMYVADALNNVVREIDLGGHTERIVAGTGFPVYGRAQDEEGVEATKAHLKSPAAVAVSPGRLYIADTGNNRVRAVDLASGTITTVAGSGIYGNDDPEGIPARDATLGKPRSLAVAGSGSLLIGVDFKVRKVSGGIISTVAGLGPSSTETRPSDPMDPACATNGLATPPCTTVARDARLYSVVGLAAAPDGSVFVLDEDSRHVYRVQGDVIETVAANRQAKSCLPKDPFPPGGTADSTPLCSPSGLAVDGRGNLFISDVGYHRVLRVDGAAAMRVGYPKAPLTTYAGTGVAGSGGDDAPAVAAQLNAPTGIAADTDSSTPACSAAPSGTCGNLFVADTGNHVVRRVTADSGYISRVSGDGACCRSLGEEGLAPDQVQLSAPDAVASDALGDLFIADTENHRVLKVVPSTNAQSVVTLAGTGTAGFSGDNGPAASAQLNRPRGVVADSAGNVFIADSGNNLVRRIDTSGTITTVAGNAAGPPVGAVVMQNGSAGQLASNVPGNDGGDATKAVLQQPVGVAVGANGSLYISEAGGNRIRKLDGTGKIATVAGTGQAGYADGPDATTAQVKAPRGLALDAAGNLYIADFGNDRVRKLEPGGAITTLAGPGAAVGGDLSGPSAVAVRGDGDHPEIFIAEQGFNRVRRVQDNKIARVAGVKVSGYAGDGGPATEALLDNPEGVAVGPEGLFIADRRNNRIRRVELDSSGPPAAPGPVPPPPTDCNYEPQSGPPGAAPGNWTPAGCMAMARWAHTATRLGDGRVLVAGGYQGGTTTGGPLTATAEIYDPSRRTWSPAAPMHQARAGHTAVLLDPPSCRAGTAAPDYPCGRVLVTGGRGNPSQSSEPTTLGPTDALASAELFNPTGGAGGKGVWESAGKLNLSAPSGHLATLLGGPECAPPQAANCGKVLITGGSTNAAELYDPVTRVSTLTAPTTAVHRLGTATVLTSGAVLVAGGVDESFGRSGTSDAELFDPATATWRPVRPMENPRYLHVATLLPDGSVLVAGGRRQPSGPDISAELFDPVAGTWTAAPPMAIPDRASCPLEGAGGILEICQTFSGTLVPGTSTVLVAGSGTPELYDPASGFRLLGPALDTANGRRGHTATSLSDGTVLVAGGFGLASAEIFDRRPIQPPLVTGVYPPSGPPAGGTRVVLNGLGLDSLTSVTFGGTAVPYRRSEGPTVLVVTSPPHPIADQTKDTEEVAVSGSGAGGTVARAGTYRYGTWSASAGLVTARGAHSATALPDGNVVIAGGGTSFLNDKVLGSLQQTERYRTATGASDNAGFLPDIARSESASVLLTGVSCARRCNQVLLVGGVDPAGTPLRSTALFDPLNSRWTSAAPLSANRSRPTATLLRNGRVLVAGGDTDGTAELYNPANDSWTRTNGTMQVVRTGHTANLLPSGQVLVLGGDARGSAEIYNPATDAWTSAPLPPVPPRRGHTATTLSNGSVLVVGGIGTSGPTDAVQRYDPQGAVWSTLPSMDVEGARWDHTANLLANGNVLVAGGSAAADSGVRALDSASLFDPAAGTWSHTSRLIGARFRHQATSLPDGAVLITGGFDSNGYALSGVEVYSGSDLARPPNLGLVDPPVTPTLHPGPVRIVGTGMFSAGTTVHFVARGSKGEVVADAPADSVAFVSDTEVSVKPPPQPQGSVMLTLTTPSGQAAIPFTYGPGAWGPGPSLAEARYGHTATLLDPPLCQQPTPPAGYPCGQVLVVGGVPGAAQTPDLGGTGLAVSALRSIERYDPASGTWSAPGSVGSLTVGRQAHTATLLNDGRVLVVGGSSVDRLELADQGSSAMTTAEIYDPVTGISTITSPLNTPRVLHATTLLADGKVLVSGGLDRGAAEAARGDAVFRTSTAAAEVFDPVDGAWSAVEPMKVARAGHSATLMADGNVMVAGGRDWQCVPGPQNGATACKTKSVNPVGELEDHASVFPLVTETYRRSTASWATGPSMAVGRYLHHALEIGGPCTAAVGGCTKGLVVTGGVTGDSNLGPSPITGSAERYGGKRWEPVGSLRRARSGDAAATLADGSVLLAGGGSGPVLGDEPSQSSAEVYDLRAGTSVDTDPMSVPRGRATATTLDGPHCRGAAPPTYCGSVLMVGGLGGQVGQGPGRLALAGTEIYTPAPTVTSITPPIGSVLGDGPATIGGTGFGGARSVHFGDVSVACPSAACVIDSVGRMRVSPPPHGAGPVQVAVENALGTSAHLVPEAASRFVFVGPSAISDLVAKVTGEHDVHLSFTAAGDGTTTGRATRYVIKESTSPIGDAGAFDAATTLCPTKGCADGIFATFGDALTHDFDIGGLGSGRHYFSVRAENALGQLGPLSNLVSVILAPCPAVAVPGTGQVGYGGGHYSIVGLPAGTIVHAGSELFGWFDVGAGGTYVTAPLPEAGHGYWAWFACPTVVVPAQSAAAPVVLGLGGFHASIVGNPFATTAAVISGYDYAAHWDPDMNSGAGGYRISGYQEPLRLGVGEGVWTFSYSPTQVRIEAGS